MTAFRQLRIGLAAVMLLIVIGTVGFHYIEEWTYLDSLYMTIITLATVGFREVAPLTPWGKMFTIVLIVLGVTMVFWVLTSLIQLTVGEQIWHALARKRMEERIAKLSDHFIICGFGRMGQQISRDFTRHKTAFCVIELNPEQLPRLVAWKIPFVEGNASEDRVLIAAGIKRARGLVTVAASDAENIFITLSARVLNPKLYIVARSILEENEDKIRRAGADRVMSPYVLGGRRMAEAALHPQVIDFLDTTLHTEDLDLEMQGIAVEEGSRFAGCTLQGCAIRRTTGVTVLAIKRSDGQLLGNPSPETSIRNGDTLIALGRPEQLRALAKLAVG